MIEIEHAARERGFTLLTLDAKADGPADRLYRALGWTFVGRIPGFALDPDGQALHDDALFFKALAERSHADPPPASPCRLHHVAIICSDFPRSRDFYTRVLGLRTVRESFRPDRRSHKLDLALQDGVQIELFSFPDPPPRPTRPEACGLRHLALAVSNIDAELARLASFGVAAEPVRTDEHTGRRFTFIRDPDDLPIELYEQP
ncbi:MAG: VOC family protein [Phycisphaerae bacterium]|nr:VOC family protein [Phycisphaerae bacterium]